MAKTYHSKLDQRYTARLRTLEKELPYFCTQYFNAKSQVIEKQSAYAYALDIRIFFRYLKQSMPELYDTELKDIPVSLLDNLTSHDIDAYLSYLEENDEYANSKNEESGKTRKLASIKSLFKYLLRQGMITRNPAELVEMPKMHKHDIKILTDEEIERLLDVIENETGMKGHQKKINEYCCYRDYAIMMLFLGTGMRISELAGLDLSDISFKDNSAKIIRKGGNEQYIYFDEQIAEALKKYLRGDSVIKGTRAAFKPDKTEQALFISRKRKRLSTRSIQELVSKYSMLAFGEVKEDGKIHDEKKLHAHLFRKTYGTKLYLDTNDIKLVQDTLGHSSISTTEKHYVVSSEEHKKRAARPVLKKKI